MATFFKSLFAILLSFIVSIVVFSLIIAGLILGVATYVTPAVEAPKRGSILEINLAHEITDSPTQLPLINLRKMQIESRSPLSLLSSLHAIEAAADDPNITALSLRMDGEFTLPLALSEELRDAVIRFKTTSGKPVYSYSQSYTQSSYYLATAADSLFLEPLGAIEWQGIATSSYYYGDLLKGLNIGVEAFRPTQCRYKSAVEPYLLSQQSDEAREQSQRLVDELWRGVVGQVAVSRNIDTAELRKIARQEILVSSQKAKYTSMVDAIAYHDQYEESFERCGVMRNNDGKLQRITLPNYAMLQEQNADINSQSDSILSTNKVGVIYADGVIMDGESESGNDPIVGSQTICRLLKKAREDSDIKAVILRVNSPGGSALAADVMWREVELLREEKPVIVSMGSYAASGGYYISAPADMIVADRYTLTGSIGVYSLIFDIDKALSHGLKVNIDGVGSESSADFGRVPRALNNAEKNAMQRSVNEVYDSFTNKVATGRNLPIGVVSTLSGGRVWSGVEAQACGLVDAVGGIHAALALAIDRASLSTENYTIEEVTDNQNGIDMLMNAVGIQLKTLMPMPMRQLEHMKEMKNNLIMHQPTQINF